MNEDDTFNALKRTPEHLMWEVFGKWLDHHAVSLGNQLDGQPYRDAREELFNEHGWTWDEYFKARNERR